MWVDYKPVGVEIDDDNIGIFNVFEMRIGINEFDHRILAPLKQQLERSERRFEL